MISLAISAMLLVAIGAAFSASAQAVQMNDDFFRATQAGRVTLNQMLTEIRRADSVAVPATHDTVKVIRPRESCVPNELYREFRYDAATQAITLQIFYKDNTASRAYVLANKVAAASFGPPDTVTGDNNASVVVRVPVTLAVRVGNTQVRLNGSSGPRREQDF
jgi:Tfp pilus assembly protein PilW